MFNVVDFEANPGQCFTGGRDGRYGGQLSLGSGGQLRDMAGIGRGGASLGWVRRACYGDAERIYVSTTRRERREDDVLRPCRWGMGGNRLACETRCDYERRTRRLIEVAIDRW